MPFPPPDFLGERGKTQARVREGLGNYRTRGLPPPPAIQTTVCTQVNLPEAQF